MGSRKKWGQEAGGKGMQGGAGYKGYAKLEVGNLDTPVPLSPPLPKSHHI